MKPRKAQTNWTALVVEAIIICFFCFLYGVFFSSIIESYVYMVGGVALLIILYAIQGTIKQSKLDLELKFKHETRCCFCGTDSEKLAIIYYSYAIWLGIYFTFSRTIKGKMCYKCAKSRIDKAFILNIIGCILFPPAIVYAFIQRHYMLKKFN